MLVPHTNKEPLVIGKAKKPIQFNGFYNPLHCDFSKNAWMTFRFFFYWFHNIFRKEVRFTAWVKIPQTIIQ